MMRLTHLKAMSTSAQKKRIEFYYDIFSPYTWFAFEVLMRYKKHWNINLELKPFFLAAVSKEAGNSAPMLVPNKAYYMGKDLVRLAKYFNVPLKLIEDPAELVLVKGSLIPNRFLTATDILYPKYMEPLSRALWMAVWNRDEDFTQKEVLSRAGEESGMNQEELSKILEHMTRQETKDRLKAYTQEAIDYRAFGSPSIVAHVGREPMLFFGSESIPSFGSGDWRKVDGTRP